jgi:uncharacterized membrane protein YraQ (UPF0718 family)
MTTAPTSIEAPPVDTGTSGLNSSKVVLYTAATVLGVVAWWFLYSNLARIAAWLTYSILQLPAASHLGTSVEFFLYEVPKVMMLLVLIVFAVGVIRTFFTPQRTRQMLAGKRESVGNVLAAGLGVVTPFCSCSAVPLFIGFVTAGVPLGVTFSFLIAAPMVNEVALVMLFGLFGWKVALVYAGSGLTIAMIAGWTIGRLKLESWVEPWVYETSTTTDVDESHSITWRERLLLGRDAVREIVGRVWPYVVLGIAIGAGIHGYVPEGKLASFMGRGVWWAVPLAVVLGVPMYSNAAGMIPVVQSLLGKGAALGTALAFMMAVTALSLPEAVILRKVLKPKLIAVFFSIVAGGIVIVGFLMNSLMM